MGKLEIVMVKLSNKGRYGVRAVFDIAYHSDGRATQIRSDLPTPGHSSALSLSRSFKS